MTREQRIELIKKFIYNIDMFEDIQEYAMNIREDSLVEDEYPDDCNKPIRYYDMSKVEAVEYAYVCSYGAYFENEEVGLDFVDHYYGELTNEFYEELEEACKQVVREFNDSDIEEFFHVFDQLKDF